jgi:cellulose synthase/poly-beta-1,6-N-acetylglucosamine synthase-like glycosyltransferase
MALSTCFLTIVQKVEYNLVLLSSNLLIWLSLLLQFLYAIGALGLALYGGQALWLNWQLHRRRQTTPLEAANSEAVADWPRVTVQLPVYNERYVVERLVDACAQLDYPIDRLQIQILDDSTDQTTLIAEKRSALWRQQGIDVKVYHRQERPGYKAGALAEAMPQAHGEYIAIFDADFVPFPDFLRRMIPHFLIPQNQRVGFVQSRWGHLNSGYSPLTRAQALALDGHFVVEQAARQAAGYPFGFNGSAGIWRRACIEDPKTGGWQADTLCEDLDLSYRAQLAGWQPLYLNDVEVPAEIPPQLLAFKRQQFRWAKGSVQTLKKLSGAVWHSGWSLPRRIAALFHLGNYLIHPLLLFLLLVTLPLLLLDIDPFWPLAYLSLISIGPPLLYAVAQRRLHPESWFKRWSYLPLLMLLGMGLCLNNSRAVWHALRSHASPFLRTPKFQVNQAGEQWQRSSYKLAVDSMVVGELLLCLYACAAMGVAFYQEKWWTVPFLFIYAAGFAYMAGAGLGQDIVLGRPRARLKLRMLLRRVRHGRGARPVTENHPEETAGFKAVDFVKSRGR